MNRLLTYPQNITILECIHSNNVYLITARAHLFSLRETALAGSDYIMSYPILGS